MGCSWSSTKQEIIDEYAKLRDQAATDRVEAELERGTYHTPRLHGEAGTCPRNTDDDEGLVLEDILRFQHRSITAAHLGVLFAIDSEDQDGRFTLPKILRFARMAHKLAKRFQRSDAGFMINGYCSLLLWRALQECNGAEPVGRKRVINWILAVVSQQQPTRTFEGFAGPFLHVDTLMPLHELLEMERTQDTALEEFVARLQNAAAEQRMMDPDDSTQAEYVPLDMLRIFADSLCDGISSMVGEFFHGHELADILDGVPPAASGMAGALEGGPLTRAQQTA